MAAKGEILIAEDDERARRALAELLADDGWSVTTAADGDEASSRLAERPFDLVLLDIRMPGKDGLEILREASAMDDPPAVLVMTAYGASSVAIEAMKLGAYDYLSKPLHFDELRIQVGRAIEDRRRARRLESYRQDEAPDDDSTLIGSSRAMQQVYKQIGQVAPTDSTVLILGESGSGKELIAREIHRHSRRAEGRWVAVNCAAIPDELLEAELFGYEKGAFTGATARRMGRFEAASGGTIFLDEIGELSPAMQAKLLRVVQERTVERLGSNTPIRLDVRILAATNLDLETSVGSGGFREDLYYRLNVFAIRAPSLRERPQDVLELAPRLLQRIAARLRAPAPPLTDAALEALRKRDWPGNVRELEHTLERALITSRGGPIGPEHVAAPRAEARADAFDSLPLDDGLREWVRRLEKRLVERALDEEAGNRTRAAERLGIHRRLLYEKIKEFGL